MGFFLINFLERFLFLLRRFKAGKNDIPVEMRHRREVRVVLAPNQGVDRHYISLVN